MVTTTSDPAVVFGIVLATSGAWLLIALLVKRLVDEFTTYTPVEPSHRTTTPLFPTARADHRPHSQPTAPDETVQLTTVQPHRARHAKGHPTC
ncbi:hypothetical protein [Streptomyces sp. NPDC002845]